ncbi:GntP family permease [Halodurantibacterium flavum]|uniref:GntP family permease n=1 Tax=Halodurantibacterium flavum TaxID=1382802 RepID=A0ABW4S412_9RHOB
MDLFGIFISLILLMYLAYRGINVLILAPILSLLAVAMAGGLPIMATYTQVFMRSLGNYVVQFFPLFMLGAIFGKLMADSGSARAIAEWGVNRLGAEQSILAIVLSCGILTYGGVSLFVVAFAVYPIANALFRRADVPKRLIPAAIALGSFTFTMTALPGTPAIQNAIPAPFFGTDAFAAPLLGLIAGLIMAGGGVLWLNWRRARLAAAGEGYGDHPVTEQKAADVELPSVAVALAPAMLVIALNALFTYIVIPNLDNTYLAQPEYGATDVSAVRGVWAIIGALVASIALLLALHWRRYRNVLESVNQGTYGALLPIFNTASEVGYGAVIASLPAFALIRDAVLNIAPGNPLISVAVATNVLAGVTGSASGGMSIALQTLGEQFRQLAETSGVSLELMHRVTALASGGFDALPHNGAVITLLGICGLTHRQSYPDIFVVAVAIPVLATIVVITLGSLAL